MNLSSLKSFAPEVRRQLIEAVTRKLDFVLTADTADLRAAKQQVAELRRQADDDRAGLIDRVSYTWFNRLAALRFLDARGWHPFRARVLTPSNAVETQPELLKLTRTGALPEELRVHANTDRLNDLLDGRIPSPDAQGEVYRHLVLAACHFYHALLPNLFEKLDDETELLLPDDLLTEHSVVHGFRTKISDEDCGDGQRANVEILGWLYQFYISERKDQVMARKSAVPTEDIPAVTQLFTPHWIVRYLVENSLGRLWLLNRPGSRLREHMPYYIEGEPETDFLKITKPEEIRLVDPAVGSGHMLTYAFDLLTHIYEEEGFAPTEIPALILRHNLHGLEICPRAAQLAELALVFKAREGSPRFFQREQLVRPNIKELRAVRFAGNELRDYIHALELDELCKQPVLNLLNQFEDAKTLGSLIQPGLDERAIAFARDSIEAKDLGDQLFLHETHKKVLRVLDQAEALTQRYHVVVANPPYMGSGFFNAVVKEFIATNYSPGRYDLYAAFIQRDILLVKKHGFVAMITMPNWLFLGSESFVKLRKKILFETRISSLVHAGRGVWGADFGSVAFVLHNAAESQIHGTYKRLFRNTSEVASNDILSRRYLDREGYPAYECLSDHFLHIPGHIIAYWLSEKCRTHFKELKPLGSAITSREGMATGNNELFLRRWHEASLNRIDFTRADSSEATQSSGRWFPYNKGGDYRKWYGNNELIVDWENNGERIRSYKDEKTGRIRSHNYNGEYAFCAGITWSALSISRISVRHSGVGFLFDSKGAKAFSDKGTDYYMALINSAVGELFLKALSPGVDFKVGDIIKIPLIEEVTLSSEVSSRTSQAISLSKDDWDNSETSWDFRDQPLLRGGLKGTTLEASWQNWKTQSTTAIRRMQELETENNRLFISAYGLEGELQPEVPEAQITLSRTNVRRDIASFLSFAVGCMMGRYSIDHPGLILANSGETLENFLEKVDKPLEKLTFAPDDDGIIPILDGEWFDDDIVARTRAFLRATFGEPSLDENLRFIEESLGKDLRKYFLTDFYKDHLQTYKKRPIYWMFSTPKKGFTALIYLHRYSRDTANKVLNRYLREYVHKLNSRLQHLDHQLASEALSAREKTQFRKETEQLRKTIRECQEYERDILLPLAQERIELDLDDGVKVNYLKLGKALAPIPGLAAADDE